MSLADDTILAISSAVGPAARIILRLSGPGARELARSVSPSCALAAGTATRERMTVAGLSFNGWVYSFRGPRSYTGEDLVELHVPGNPVLARIVYDDLVARGARPAEAGEFTARAYFNGRVDLTAAEGVAAAVSASNESELRAARQLMAGGLAKRLRPMMDRLAETLGLVEVGIDFSEEDVTFLGEEEVRRRAREVDAELAGLVADSDRLERLGAEPTVVLYGRPNAGKSTLLNRLAGQERAVVSPVAGTTRDVLSAEVALPRGMVKLLDAAGLDESEPANEIERAMRRRAVEAIEGADVVVLVVERDDTRPAIAGPRVPDLVVRTKWDVLPVPRDVLGVSAVTGNNIEALVARVDELAFGGASGASPDRLALNQRHLAQIAEARLAVRRLVDQAAGTPVEILALELRAALDSLGNVLGVISPDDVLGLVFSRFCIGK